MIHTEWSDDFMGIAYRYFDLRMNIVPLLPHRKKALKMWQDVIHWWYDASIRVRFIEYPDQYRFVIGAESRRPDSNVSFYKILHKSPHYERFKTGYGDAAYLRLGEYSTRRLHDVKDSDICNCGHPAGDHADDESTECLEDGCDCREFVQTQVYMLRRKKTITDIVFLDYTDIEKDPLSWNCINSNPS